MRLIDADNLRGRVCEIFLCAEPGSAEERRLALVLGLIDSEHTITPPPNAPLTLDELRKMDGEPVWVCLPNGSYGGWMINYQGWCMNRFASTEMYGTYGKSWLAYRRKLEEGTT